MFYHKNSLIMFDVPLVSEISRSHTHTTEFKGFLSRLTNPLHPNIIMLFSILFSIHFLGSDEENL